MKSFARTVRSAMVCVAIMFSGPVAAHPQTLTRGGQRLNLGQGSDRELLLSVGDELKLHSTVLPTVHLIPVKPK